MKSEIFTCTLRVYYEDTDAGGVVYHASYLKFFERGRTEWLRALGVDQAALLRDSGIAFVVRDASLEFLKPARLDDLLTVGLEIEKLTRSQIFFRQYVWRGEAREELVGGTVQIVCVRLDTSTGKMKVISLPAPLRARLEAIR
ncbi:MAG: tol-pal system-associated acyl-CoA thioesterase [Candidatus Accumulibacter sp.]|jgi:acyl-CoA thioester hydrolase|nr:tol-pal system-associated acyl-CoA thioesterase [Accumulibacter sp.]